MPDSPELLELSRGVVLLLPHVVQVPQGVRQVADRPVSLPPQVIAQSPGGKGEPGGRRDKSREEKTGSEDNRSGEADAGFLSTRLTRTHTLWLSASTVPHRMLSLSATILSLSWKAQSRRHLATSASCVASFSSWDMASYCFLSISISLLARSMSMVAESCFCRTGAHMVQEP